MGAEQEQKSAVPHQEQLSQGELSELEANARERHEQTAERAHEQQELRHDTKEAAQEARERAQTAQEQQPQQEKRHRSPAERRKDAPSKNERAQAYDRIMSDARGHMTPASKTFSSFIHAPVVEKTSEVVGSTVARPNAILAGSVFAFLLTLAVYLVANYFGYPLSGSEAIAAFIFGWIFGLTFDYFKAMATGGR